MPEALLAMFLLWGSPKEPANHEITLDSAVEQVTLRQARLRRLYLDVYMTTHESERTQTDRFAVAFAPECCFLDFMHHTHQEKPPWHDDARFQLWLLPEGDRLFTPFGRILQTEPDPQTVHTYWDSSYAQATGWHPHAKRFEQPEGEPLFLDHLFAPERRSHLRLNPQTETVNSLECVVIETDSRSDRIWLAPSLNFAVVKRVILRGEGDHFKKIYTCSDFKKAGAALWLPRKVEGEIFRKEAGDLMLSRSFQLDVQRLLTNESVSNALFQFNLPPGTIAYDSDRKIVGFETGGKELMNLWGVLCSEYFPPQPASLRFRWQGISAFIILGAAFGSLLCMVYKRRYRK